MSHLPSERSIDSAKTCLEWHSWLDYERLTDLNSHLSRVYHTLATQVGFGLIAVEDNRAAHLLASLNEANFRSILLKIYSEDGGRSSLAFFIENPYALKDWQSIISSISGNFEKTPFLMPEKGKLLIFGVEGAEHRKFSLDNMRPNHLRRILSLMLDAQIAKVETGVFDANPLITRQIYTQAGLVSDVPMHLLKTAWSRLHGTSLIRPRRDDLD